MVIGSLSFEENEFFYIGEVARCETIEIDTAGYGRIAIRPYGVKRYRFVARFLNRIDQRCYFLPEDIIHLERYPTING